MHIIYYYHKFQGIIYWILLFLSDLNDTRSSDLSIVIFLILAVLCLKIHVPYHSFYMFDKKDVFTNIIGMKKLVKCVLRLNYSQWMITSFWYSYPFTEILIRKKKNGLYMINIMCIRRVKSTKLSMNRYIN